MYMYDPVALHRLREEQLVRDAERRRAQLEHLELRAQEGYGGKASVRDGRRTGGARETLFTLLLRVRRS